MIHYPHFAFPQLRLVNGYQTLDTEDGTATIYEQEDELEHCIRRLLLRRPAPLRGCELRFLRRGLGLTQASFGELVDRDAQTVARWEKSDDAVPRYVDLTARVHFAARFEPTLSVREILSFVNGSTQPLPSVIYLTWSGTGWSFDFNHTFIKAAAEARSSSATSLPAAGPVYRIIERKLSTLSAQVNDDSGFVLEFVAEGLHPVSLIEASRGDITTSSVFIPPSYFESRNDEHSKYRH